MSHPANLGRICVRGWHVHEVASSPDRLHKPLVRKNGELVPVGFAEAYDYIAAQLSKIKQQHGADAIGFLNSARCSNEDSYIFQKFSRTIIGTNNVAQGTSLYRSATVDVLRSMIGTPAATNPISDIFKSKVIILNELDIGQQLPTIGGHIIRAKLDGAKLIVVGQRRHRVVEHADIFLNIKPDTEGCLYAAMAKIIVDRGLVDLDFIRAHCSQYNEFVKNIQSFDILYAANRCDIDPALIEQAAIMYAQNTPGMLLYAAGSENIGAGTLAAMVNLVLLTGNIGKEGSGIMPLAEHNNEQGCCDMGMLPKYLPGYVPVNDAAAKSRIEKVWNAKVPEAPGIDAIAMFSQPTKLKAIWLDRHNPVVSASYRDAGEVLKNMEFVVLQNLFLTKTAQHAHVVLPVVAYGEEDVTFTSTERRIQRAVKAIEPPTGLVSAWQQVAEVAKRMGAKWNYTKSSDVLEEVTKIVPDYAGVTQAGLDRDYGLQWPCTHEHPLGAARLFTKVNQSQQFIFGPALGSVPQDTAQPDFPFILSFGHSQYYWHQNTLIRHSETLKREYGILLLDYPEGFVEINDDDAKTLSIRDSQRIRIASAGGEALTCARVTSEVRRGIVFVPFFLQDVMRSLGQKNVPSNGTQTHVRIEKAV